MRSRWLCCHDAARTADATPSSATANGASSPTTNSTTGSGHDAAFALRVAKPSPSFPLGRRHTASTAFDADNPGRWLFHCHNLYHQATGMMTEVAYTDFA